MNIFKKIFNPNADSEQDKESQVNEMENQENILVSMQQKEVNVVDSARQLEDIPSEPEPTPDQQTTQEQDPQPKQEQEPNPQPPVPDKPEKPAKANPAPMQQDLGDNIVDTSERLVKAIVDALKALRGMADDQQSDMTIFVQNPVIMRIMGERFESMLRTRLDDNMLSAFAAGKIEFVKGEAPDNNAIEVLPGVMQLILNSDKGEKQSSTRGGDVAVVAITQGMGTLENNEYELDSSKKAIFHIGRGTLVKRNNRYRMNDVAIKAEESNEEMAAINNRVSSSQADIVWKGGVFYLHAMPSGCRPEGGSATKIYRDDVVKELRDTSTFERLYDGDLIELGGALLLSFHIKPGERKSV